MIFLYPGLSNSGGLLYIFTCSHLHHIFSSSHLHTFTSSHLHIFSSSQPHIFTSSQFLTFTSSHLHTSSLSFSIFTSSHLLIFTSSLSFSLLPSVTVSLLLFLFSLRAAGSADEAPQHGHPFARNGCQKLKKNCDLTTSAATFSHETTFECQKLMVFCEFGWSGGNPFARNEVRVSKTEGFLRVWLVWRQPFRTK